MSTKISQFTTSGVSLTSNFTFISNNTNLKAPISDLVTLLGTTGTLTSVGESLAIPVLTTPTTGDNQIRKLLAGSGIGLSLGAQNAIKVKQNFTFNKTGESLVVSETVDSPIFKSIVGGTDMQVTTDGNTILLDVQQGAGSDTVFINEESDFPAAVAGVITLLANTVYVIASAVTTANRFVFNNNSTIYGYSLLGPMLTYSGTGTAFTSIDKTIGVSDLLMTAPNGKVFDCSSTGFNLMSIRNLNILKCADVGSFSGLLFIAMNNIVCQDAEKGMDFSGAMWSLISIIDPGFISTSASFIGIDLGTAVADNIDIKGGQITAPAGAIGIKGAAANANLTATGRGNISNMNFVGDLTPLSGIVISDDVQWESQENQGIVDTHPDSLSHNTAGVTVTISGVNTPTLIAGTWVDDLSQHFTVSGSGRVTYNGVENMSAPVSLSVTADPVSGSAKDFRVYIAVNGTEVTASGVPARASAGDRTPVTVIWQREFATNDYIEAFISNETDAVNFDVIHAVLRIN
jgi:hypothetical protein